MSQPGPRGWIVRVTMADGVRMLYAAGYGMPNDAEAAVQATRATMSNETYDAVDPIMQNDPLHLAHHEVRELSTPAT